MTRIREEDCCMQQKSGGDPVQALETFTVFLQPLAEH